MKPISINRIFGVLIPFLGFWVTWWRDHSPVSTIRQGEQSIWLPLFSPRRRQVYEMSSHEPSEQLASLVGETVVVDLRSTYVCLGILTGFDREFLSLRDADLHDFRDSSATREVYVYDSARLGIRRNRAQVLLRRDEIVAVTRFADISES